MTASVTRSLDRWIEEAHTEREPDGFWHPSSLGLCGRQAVLGKTGVEKTDPVSISSKRNFFQGHLIHEVAQEALHFDPGYDEVYSEVKLAENDWGIAGSADAIVRDGKKWHLIEIKSLGSKHTYVTKTGLRFYKLQPEPHHVIQAAAYGAVLSRFGGTSERDKTTWGIRPLGDALVDITFAYISKVNFEVREFTMPLTEAVIAKALTRIRELNVHVENGTLPDRLPLERNKAGVLDKAWPCRTGCEWASLCWPV